jgi:hypothetical protein
VVPGYRQEGASPARLRLRRTGDLNQPLTVGISVSGAVQPGIDYREPETPVTFSSGSSETNLDICPIQVGTRTALASDGESLLVNLAPGADYELGQPNQGLIKIESCQEINLSAPASEISAGAVSPGQIVFGRTGPTNEPTTVHFELGGSALAGVDYANLERQVTIPAGATSATVPIETHYHADQWTATARKTIVVSLSQGRGYRWGPCRQATLILVHRDLPTVDIQATVPVAKLEGPVSGEFTLSRTHNLSENLVVYLGLINSPDFRDYCKMDLTIGSTIPVIIPFGKAATTIPVVPWDNGALDYDYPVTLALVADPSYQLGNPDQATVTIQDAPWNQPAVSIRTLTSVAFMETRSIAAVELTRSGGTNLLAVEVFLSGTAANGVDYEYWPSPVYLPTGTNRATFTIRPLQNARGEGTKTVEVALVSSTNYSCAKQSNVTVQIRDIAYHVWRVQKFGPALIDPAIVGRDADPDHDGYNNFLEYLFDMDPAQPDRPRPEFQIAVRDDHRYLWTYFYVKDHGYEHLTLEMRYSTNGVNGVWRIPADPFDRRFDRWYSTRYRLGKACYLNVYDVKALAPSDVFLQINVGPREGVP